MPCWLRYSWIRARISSLLMEKMFPEADEPETATDSVAIDGGMPGTGMPEGATESLFSALPLPAPASAAITESV